MKVLSTQEMQAVSGGDFQVDLSLHVPSAQGSAIATLVEGIVTGQFQSTADFVNALTAAGDVLDQVRVTNIGFSEFN